MRSLVAKPDLTEQTHQAIRDAIMSGDLAPCAPLAQEDLAEQLGVSRQPISHALALLKREGLIVDRGRKGQMVAPIEADRLLNLYQVRGTLDRLAARLTALRTVDKNGLESELTTLLKQGEAACSDANVNAMVEADLAFHKLLHQRSGNVEITKTAEPLWLHMVRSMRVVLQDVEGRPTIWEEHQEIADAVLSGDPDKAGELAARHAEMAGEATFKRLQQLTND